MSTQSTKQPTLTLLKSTWFLNYLVLAALPYTTSKSFREKRFGDPESGVEIERICVQDPNSSLRFLVSFRRSHWKHGVSHRRVSDSYEGVLFLNNGDRRHVRHQNINHVAKCVALGHTISSHYLI